MSAPLRPLRAGLRRRLPLPIVACLLLLLSGAAQARPDLARLDEIVRSYVDSDEFMGTVLVARGDSVWLSRGYGSANLEWEIPNAPDTRFRLGSITKQFTAAGVLALAEQGRLGLDDPVGKWLTETPKAWDGITLKHLLTHSSGIPSFTDLPDYQASKATATTPEQLVARFRDLPLEFKPGERFSYSNSGYILLGHLIERVSGQSYAEFLQERLFTPAGLQDTGLDSNRRVLARRAAGYERGAQEPVNTDFIHMSVPFSAGALYSTTEDLLRWQLALYGGRLLGPDALAAMLTQHLDGYALGVMVHVVNGRRVVEHGGGIEGFNTHLAWYPDEQLSVIVLGNLSGPAPGDLAGKLAAVAFGETVTLARERRAVELPTDVLQQVSGSYELRPDFLINVFLTDGQLMTQATGQEAFPLFAESATLFFLKVVDAQLEFQRDASGQVTGAVLHQGGQAIPLKRR